MEFSFVYDIPTKVFFGDQIDQLSTLVKRYGQKVMIIYDGEHVKTSGLYDRIIKQLDKVSAEVIEFREVRPESAAYGY